MEKDVKDYKAIINPTYLTAQATLVMLAMSGDENAKKYADIVDVHQIGQNMGKNDDSTFTPEEMENYLRAVTLTIEARYKIINSLMEKSGINNVLDIACGYAPRALHVTNSGRDYVGLDIPTVIDQMETVADQLIPNHPHPVYIAGDVTNTASLNAAADLLKGEVFISCEGLIVYLSQTELNATFQNIRQVLLNHGGAWYSSDFEVDYGAVAGAGIGDENGKARYEKSLEDVKSRTEIYFNSGEEFLSSANREQYLGEMGLKVEKIPFYDESIKLNVMEAMTPEQKERITKLLKTFNVWKITADSSFEKADSKTDSDAETEHLEADKLTIDSKVSDGNLAVQLGGRLDTLSAPDFLRFFDETCEKHTVSKMEIDLKNLEYISSAGLRTVLMMAKKLGTDNLEIINSNELVREVFNETGFSQILHII